MGNAADVMLGESDQDKNYAKKETHKRLHTHTRAHSQEKTAVGQVLKC